MRLTSKKELVNYTKPYIIAELGANHNGDMELAKKLILQAKGSGADCVKFQSWTKDSIFSRKSYDNNYFMGDDYRHRSDFTLEEIVEEYSISQSELLAMKSFCDEVNIDCTSTPFSNEEVDFLVDELGAPFIKVASMDLNNHPFLRHIAKKGKPIVLSTGLSELSEIDKAIQIIEGEGNTQICILHCVSTYPPQDVDVNLHNIVTLQKIYPDYPIGFSDHTIGYEIALASVALGACAIEKHFTLDKSMPGWDHKVSATEDEMRSIVDGAERITQSLGSYRITATESDEKKTEFRRSIVLARSLKKGDIIKFDDLSFKRPGSGIQPEFAELVVGLRVNKDIDADVLLSNEDFI